jgi:parallel beta-helix repeat protein
LIGVNATVTARLPNYYGVSVAAAHTTIGGTAPNTGNVISGFVGIKAFDNVSDYTTVQGNYIGTDPTGARDLGCDDAGVSITADRALIGGTQPGARNSIAFNFTGVRISPDAQNARILGNSIYNNSVLGIHLVFSGNGSVPANDPGDPDFGANRLQNFPVITSAANDASGNTVIKATFNSEKDKHYRIEFFATPKCNNYGYGEGRTYLGTVNAYTAFGTGDAYISFTPSVPVSVGSFITATATHIDNTETSGFSACKQVTGQPVASTLAIIEDTYVKGATPTENFGTVASLQVKRTLNPGSGKGRQAYMRFDTSTFTDTIGKATLRVYGRLNAVTAENQNIPLAVFPASDSVWTEHTLVWTNKPAPNAPQPLAQVIVTDDTAQWYEFDITGFINSERAAGRNVTGVILRNMAKSGAGDFFTQFNSKEASLNKPQLVLAP